MHGVGDTLPLAPPGSVTPRPGGFGVLPGHPLLSLWSCWGGPAQPRPRSPPPPPSLRGVEGGGGGYPGGLGRGGEGKEVGLWRRDPMSPKNVPRSQPF